jgi:hypothetical protein
MYCKTPSLPVRWISAKVIGRKHMKKGDYFKKKEELGKIKRKLKLKG